MYFYVYAPFAQDHRFEKEMLKIENRLTDLGILGTIARLGLFKRADELIRDEVRRGAHTVVAVGNDETIEQILDVAADEHVAFGIIPLGGKNHIAKLLGIPDGVAACDVLSARIIETIDVGVLNGKRFICGVSVPSAGTELTCDGTFRIETQGRGSIEVKNLSVSASAATTVADPRDGRLETVIRVPRRTGLFRRVCGVTTLPLRSLAIHGKRPVSLRADGHEVRGTHFDISIEPMALRVITGKSRMF
jgi:diacylglycerol kinase family enzyme